jgi:hypothetical protein
MNPGRGGCCAWAGLVLVFRAGRIGDLADSHRAAVPAQLAPVSRRGIPLNRATRSFLPTARPASGDKLLMITRKVSETALLMPNNVADGGPASAHDPADPTLL